MYSTNKQRSHSSQKQMLRLLVCRSPFQACGEACATPAPQATPLHFGNEPVWPLQAHQGVDGVYQMHVVFQILQQQLH